MDTIEIVLVVLLALFGVAMIAAIVFWATYNAGTPSLNTTNYKFSSLTLPTVGTPYEVWVRLTLKSGVSQSDLPTAASILGIITGVVNDESDLPPATTSWTIYAQSAGKALWEDEAVSTTSFGLSIQMATVGADTSSATYSVGTGASVLGVTG